MSVKDKLTLWLSPDSYLLPILAAIILHIAVLSLLAGQWSGDSHKVMAEPVPKHIQAKVIQVKKKTSVKKKKPKARPKPKAKPKPKPKKDKKKLDLKRKQEKAKQLARKKQLQLKAREKAKKIAAQKELQEQQRLERERIEEEKQQERELQELEMQETLEQEALERELAQQLEQEQWQQQADNVTSDHMAQIQTKISQLWYYPPNSRPDMQVELSIHMLPTGEVLSVTMVKSSGNDVLDRSAMTAVKQASPLPVPHDIRIFEQRFRRFTLLLRPENAQW